MVGDQVATGLDSAAFAISAAWISSGAKSPSFTIESILFRTMSFVDAYVKPGFVVWAKFETFKTCWL